MKLTNLRIIFALTLCGALGTSPSWGAFGRTTGNARVSDSGQSNYSIPLFTPPGIRGMAPSLALNYSSGGGEGSFGFGWSLSGLSGISRCAKTWAQDGVSANVSNTAGDKFCLDGSRLRLQTGTYGQAGSTYRTEFETYSRIIAYGTAGNGPAYFIVERKDGLIYEYGNTSDSQIMSVGQPTARFWAVNKISDRSHNAILFNYTEDTTNGSFRISSIQYTQNTFQNASPQYTVSFFYNPIPAGEIDSRYLAASLIKRLTRATSIEVTRGSTLIRRYVLTYEPNLSSALKSRLQSIQECAGSGGADCLSATTFVYQNGTPGVAAEVNSGVSIGAGTMLLDVNGDGRNDLVYSSSTTSGAGTWMVAFANSSGGYSTPVNTGITNTNFTQAIPIDYNADGLDDFLVPYSGGTWWPVLGTSTGLALSTNTSIAATGAGGNARAMDINGDGLDDLVFAIVTGSTHSVQGRLRDTNGSFGSAFYLYGPVSSPYSIVGPVFGTSQFTSRRRNPDFNGDGLADFIVHSREQDPGVGYFHTWEVIRSGGAGAIYIGNFDTTGGPYWADLNGDGCSDVVYTRAGAWRYRFSNCSSLTPEFAGPALGQMMSTEAVVIDWDGDGFDDIASRNSSTLRWDYIRSNGESLGSRTDSGVSTSAVGYIFTGDVNGDGLGDLIYRSGSGNWMQAMHAGLRPDLLLTATDGFGEFSTFSYTTPAQNNYTRGSGNGLGFPYAEWQGTMPIVSGIVSSDGNGGSFGTNYWYSGALAHLQGRGMAGFWKVRRTDLRNGLIQYRYFDQEFPRTGSIKQIDLLQPDDTTVVSRTIVTNTPLVLDQTSNNQRHVVYQSQIESKQYEVSSSSTFNGKLKRSTLTQNLFYSTTGTVYDSTVTTTEPATGANGVSDGKNWISHTVLPVASLTNDIFNWCIGRPGEARITNSHELGYGAPLTRVTTTSWDTVPCRPTSVTEEPGGALQVTTTLEYDNTYGNTWKITVTGSGMPSRTTTIEYSDSDPAHVAGLFPLKLTNAEGEITLTEWDYDKGVPTKVTDPNGVHVDWLYDVFGRRIREDRPDGTYTTWTVSACQACDSRVKTLVDEQSFAPGAPPTSFDRHQLYLDLFDRPIFNYSLRPDGFFTVVKQSFDALGRVNRKDFPYSTGGSEIGYATISYDLLNRPKLMSRPIAEGSSTLVSSSVSYEGLTTVSTDVQGKTSTTMENALGQIVRSIDHTGYYQTFEYDSFGDLARVQDKLGATLQSSTYNVRGMLTSRTDMDLGSWGYSPNALGEVVSQTNAIPQTTNFSYDRLGRLTGRSEPEGTSEWKWGVSIPDHNVGRLERMTGPGYQEFYSYDSFGRASSATINADDTYHIDSTYNSIGALDTLTYPTSISGYRLKLKYGYTNGQPTSISECLTANCQTLGTNYWSANEFNPRGQLTKETLGNNLIARRAFDGVTGWLKSIQTGAGTTSGVQNLEYEWDLVGNLKKRKDKNQGTLNEEFFYDDLYRLTNSKLNGVSNQTLSYDARGNILSNDLIPPGASSPIFNYTYHATKLHQVVSTQNGWSFSYDANGNMLSGRGANITWTSFNAPSCITTGTSGQCSGTAVYSQFSYTPDGKYWKQSSRYADGKSATTIYVGSLLEKVTDSSGTDFRHLVRAGNSTIVVSPHVSGPNSVSYVTQDHLGSSSVITDSGGNVLVNLSFGAFGHRRGANWSGYPSGCQGCDWEKIAATTRRGYTDHTMLDNLNLIHMNGRVQDPLLGRFLSADPFISDPLSTQAFGRYSYVEGRPVTLTDPSGFTTTYSCEGFLCQHRADMPLPKGAQDAIDAHRAPNPYTETGLPSRRNENDSRDQKSSSSPPPDAPPAGQAPQAPPFKDRCTYADGTEVQPDDTSIVIGNERIDSARVSIGGIAVDVPGNTRLAPLRIAPGSLSFAVSTSVGDGFSGRFTLSLGLQYDFKILSIPDSVFQGAMLDIASDHNRTLPPGYNEFLSLTSHDLVGTGNYHGIIGKGKFKFVKPCL